MIFFVISKERFNLMGFFLDQSKGNGEALPGTLESGLFLGNGRNEKLFK